MLSAFNFAVASGFAALIALLALLDQVGMVNQQAASIALSSGALLIVAANWQAHRGGRNASFIFLILGFVFLCGRAFPALLGSPSELAIVSFGNVFEIAPDHVMTYIILVLTSFLCIHVGSLLTSADVPSIDIVENRALIYKWIFILLLPALLYKNIYYFNYISNNGGYLAIYRGTEHLEGVGFLARFGSLLCLATFTLYFFHETDKKKSARSLIFFLILFSTELLIGLRGKFFVTALMFFLFYKLRFGGKFSMRGLITIMLVIVSLAITVEVTREQKSESLIDGSSLLTGFISQQGVSSAVTMVVLENKPYFDQGAWQYFWHQFGVPFYSQPEVPRGWYVANDISMIIMPEAYALGFGTGSSYLAELLMLGGVAGIIVGSLIIGGFLSKASQCTQGIKGSLMFWIVCGVVYYPRTMLQDPVHNMLRYVIPIILVAGLCFIIRQVLKLR